MRLTAVFEHWHLGDGNYPAFAVGDEARLSFELDISAATVVSAAEPEVVHSLRNAEYEIVGRVLRQYPFGADTFPVVEAGEFRFYCPASAAAELPVGAKVRLTGHLALDHYQWVEFLSRYDDPPDLFYGVRVTRVRRVPIPDRFIHRSGTGIVGPASLAAAEYDAADMRDVQAVNEEDTGWSFSVLDLEVLPPGTGPTRPTFLSA